MDLKKEFEVDRKRYCHCIYFFEHFNTNHIRLVDNSFKDVNEDPRPPKNIRTRAYVLDKSRVALAVCPFCSRCLYDTELDVYVPGEEWDWTAEYDEPPLNNVTKRYEQYIKSLKDKDRKD